MLLVVRVNRGEILNRGHSTAQAFERAQQGARANLGRASLRIGRGERIEQPELERDGLEAAFEEDVVGVVMGVDEARHHQLLARLDHVIDLARAELGDGFPSLDVTVDPGANGRDHAIDDEDIGDGRQIDIAGMIVDPTIADENDAAARRVSHE